MSGMSRKGWNLAPAITEEAARDLTEQASGVNDRLHGITEWVAREIKPVLPEVVEGVGAFLARYDDAAESAVLVSRLAQQTPLNLIADARALRSLHGWQMSGAIAARMVMLYNKGKRSKMLPDWWAS